MLNYVYSQVATLCYSGAAFRYELPYFLADTELESSPQLISNEVFDQISYGYVFKSLDYETLNFWEVLNFSPPRGFSAKNFIFSDDTLFIFLRF